MRRYLTIAAIVIVVLGLGVVAYFYFFPSTAGIVTAPGAPGALPAAGPQGSPPGGVLPTTNLPSTGSTPSTPTAVSERLVQIAVGPVVPGEVVTSKPATASSSPESIVTYIERQSGNVYTYNSLTKTLTRTSNRTIPGLQSAAWLPNASLALVRYLSGTDLSTTNTYGLSASGAGGFFLPQDLADVAVSATGVLTVASGVNGSAVSQTRTDGTHATALFTTPLSSIRVSFAGKSQYLIFTKPSSSLAGDAYLADSAGHLTRIAGPLDGLVALASPSGKWVLISYVQDGAMRMQLINTTTGGSLPLPTATIADKCVWTSTDSSVYCGVPQSSPAANYPDDWYQGVVHFSDRIWRIDTVGRYAQLVLDFSKEANGVLDAETLAIDPAAATLVFVNKNDGSLWNYSL